MKRLFAALALVLLASPAFAQAWSSVPYDPANFSATGSMKWHVPETANVRYKMLDTNTMVVSFSLQATTVSGVPDLELRLKIPNGRNANSESTTMMLLDNWNGVDFSQQAVGVVSVSRPGQDYLELRKINHSKWSPSVGKTYVFGQIVLELIGPPKQ